MHTLSYTHTYIKRHALNYYIHIFFVINEKFINKMNNIHMFKHTGGWEVEGLSRDGNWETYINKGMSQG